jgi:threonine dehydrogenase-like Zn-dependent dehydrogenase
MIAFGVIWALRSAGVEGEIVAQIKRDHEAALARVLGSDGTVRPGEEAAAALRDTGASPHKPMLGPEVYAGGGFPVVFDCIGDGPSLNQAIGFAAPGGRIVVLGCSGVVPELDLSFLWSRELEIHGYCGYGAEEWRGRSVHTYEVTHRWMKENPSALADLVTHRFPLAEYRRAFLTAADHARTGSVKVVVEPGT